MSDQYTTDATLPSELLQQAAEWLLLAKLFEPPQGDWRETVKSLAAEVRDGQLVALAQQSQEEANNAAYHSTLGPGGPACPREVSYHLTVTPGGLISELQGWYEAFGYAPVCREAPDHVAVEAGFVAFLYFKQAYAAATGQCDQAHVAAEALERFRAEHLAVIASPLSQALRQSGIEYLAAAAAALRARTGPAPAHDFVGAHSWSQPEGDGDECIQKMAMHLPNRDA